MLNKRNLAGLALVIVLILSVLVSCSEKTSVDREITDLVKTKLDAITSGDESLYMGTVTENDYYFRNEQLRWFTEMAFRGIQNINMEVDEVEVFDNETAVAVIHQTHTNLGESFDFTYPNLFRIENGRWVDFGYAFEETKTDRFTIKYMDGETRVDDFIRLANDAYDNLEPIFTERPHSDFEIKLFHDRELLRQRTVPSNAWLFTGWGEPNESVKLFTGHPEVEKYVATLQHELVHHITINICNNNLPVWFYEGIAMYYGNSYFGHDFSKILSELNKEAVQVTINELENTNIGIETDTQKIYDWYNTNYMYAAYLIETYGHEKYMEIWYEAGKRPFNDSAANLNFYAQNDETFGEVIMTVLGLTKDELSANYLEWLETTDIFEKGSPLTRG